MADLINWLFRILLLILIVFSPFIILWMLVLAGCVLTVVYLFWLVSRVTLIKESDK